MHLPEQTKIVSVSVPKDYSSSAGTTEWVNMGLYHDCDFIIHCGAWAGGSAAVSLKEAINASGSSSASLALSEYWTNKSSTSTDTLTKTSVSSSSFALSTANEVAVVHVDAEDLSDGKDYVNITVGTPGSNSDFYSILAILSNPRYASDTPPSAIT